MNIDKNSKIIKILSVAIVLLIVFYAGMKFSSRPSSQNGPQNMMGQNATRNGARGNKSNFTGNVISGEVLSKDATSITVKLKDGGSRIIFFGTTTMISKSVAGSIDDVAQGNQVMVVGKPNPDGSASAESIQIRPPQK